MTGSMSSAPCLRNASGEGCTGEFHESLCGLSGVIVFHHAVLGNERHSRVQLFGNANGNGNVPEYLQFLFDPYELGQLLGIKMGGGHGPNK